MRRSGFPRGVRGDEAELITDPECVAYRAVSASYGKLWDLYQGLVHARSGYSDLAMRAVTEAYCIPPPAPDEVRNLLAKCAGYECATQFSNRLAFRLREESRMSEHLVDPQTGRMAPITNRMSPWFPK